MEAIKMIPYVVLALAVAGIIAGASMLSTQQFADHMTQCVNGSYVFATSATHPYGYCANNSIAGLPSVGPDGTNLTDQYYSMTKALDGQATVTEQLPTVAIIAVLVVIISLLAGVFVYMKYFG